MQEIFNIFNKNIKEIKKKQTVMNNTITEIKNNLKGINSRITEAEEWINDLEDEMVKVTALELNKEKQDENKWKQPNRSLGDTPTFTI